MKYYILFKNVNTDEMELRVINRPDDVAEFCEGLINEHNYSITDFRVIEGNDLSLKAIPAPTKVMLVTP